MSDTPISDSTPHNVADLGMLCRTLERLAAVRLDYINQLEANNNAANAEIERLKKSNLQLREGAEEQKQRIHSLIAERDTAQTYADQKWKLRREFHDLFGTDDVEQAVAVVRDMNDRIKRLEDFASRFLNPDDLGWAIGKYDRDEAREALGKERVESK
jgi:predicted RNase H-like nuclease (RuvC/YqgF family)